MTLPHFKYHPHPIASRSIKESSETCDCCGRARGFVYNASFYSRQRPKPKLCPWCIDSGEAAKKFEGKFSAAHPLQKAGIAEDIVRDVCERTPGYNSWQQQVWQSHCGDACAFHGDAEPSELRALSEDALAQLLRHNGLKPEHWHHWPSILAGYQKGGNPAIYKFVCRHCATAIYSIDMT